MKRDRHWLFAGLIVVAIVSIVLVTGLLILPQGSKEEEMASEQTRLINGFSHLKGLNDYDYDFALAHERGLCGSSDGPDLSYLDLQSTYDRALSSWLGERLDIAGLDADLEAHGIKGYHVGPDDPADTVWEWFRSRSHIESPYLYLRSNLRIERLSPADAETLRTASADGSEGAASLAELVGRTYQDVTSYRGTPNLSGPDIPPMVMYFSDGTQDPQSELSNLAPCASLVLWLTFETPGYRNDSLGHEERSQAYEEAMRALRYIKDEVIPQYEESFSQELGYPVRIFVHDNPMTSQQAVEFDEAQGNRSGD